MKKFFIIMLTFALLFGMVSCTKSDDESSDVSKENVDSKGNEKQMNYDTKNPIVEIEVEDYGVIAVELYPDVAPNTVNNFISLVKSGFYDNNTIHRCQAGFVIQGGDPTGTGSGGPGYSIKGEFAANGFKNDLKHTTGVISMARASNNYNSAGSQFFIMLGDASSLDGDYAAFGKVIAGLEVARKIENDAVPVNYMGMLAKPFKIKKAYVDTKGVNYPEPEKVK